MLDMENIMFLDAVVYYKDLPDYLQFWIVFIMIFFLVCAGCFYIPVTTIIDSEKFSKKYNKQMGIKTNGIKPAFLIISPFLSTSKGRQVLPYFAIGKNKIYHVMEIIWWSEWAKLQQEGKKLDKIILTFCRLMANIMAYAAFYTIIFWFLGLKEFQNINYIFITIIMFLWSLGFALIPTFYLYDQVSSFIAINNQYSKKGKLRILRFSRFFIFWQFANVIYEQFRAIIWLWSYKKYKDNEKKNMSK